MAIPKILEAKIQKVVKKNGAPVPDIIFEFSEGEEIGEGYVMEAIPGETIPRKILRDDKFSTAREKLPFEIGKSESIKEFFRTGTERKNLSNFDLNNS